MTRDRVLTGERLPTDDEGFVQTLRPQKLDDFIGQTSLVERLKVSLDAAKMRGEPMPHVLFHGPPGLGKTTLAQIVAGEMGANLVMSSGPALVRTADLMGFLTNLQPNDVFFIDEIHRLPPSVEEYIYPAMEDYRIDFVVDKGAFAKTINLQLSRFTLVGATTRSGLLSNAMRERFGLTHHLDFYPVEEIEQIIERSVGIHGLEAEPAAIREIAGCSRGTPRAANRLLNWVRDYAMTKGDGRVTKDTALKALQMQGVDPEGLEEFDRKFLETIIKYYGGGPVGIEAIAATLNEEVDNLVDIVEPFLLKIGFLVRTNRGRSVTEAAFKHLGVKPPKRSKDNGQKDLFSGSA